MALEAEAEGHGAAPSGGPLSSSCLLAGCVNQWTEPRVSGGPSFESLLPLLGCMTLVELC